MKKGIKILMVVLLAGILFLGGTLYTILVGKNSSTLSIMKTTFAEEVLQCNDHPKGIHFKIMGPGIIEEVLKRLNLTQDELKTYWDQGKTLLDYAQDKGITKEKLIETFKSVITEKLDQLLKDGKITQTEKENFLTNIDKRIEDFITKTPPFKKGKGEPPVEPPKNGTPPVEPPMGKRFLFDGKGIMEDVLNKLNFSLDEFKTAVKEGKSLLQFAESKGIKKDELVKVVKDVVLEKVNQLVNDGKITEEEKSKFLEKLDDFVEKFINGPGFGKGPRRGPHCNGNFFNDNFDTSPSSSNI
ncbi:MAG: hypothetical protein N3D74_06045 [Caldisericia bacterium]|nr:hypothetical protein [Caldisericia bacterium]